MRYLNVEIKSGMDNRPIGKIRRYWDIIITYDEEQFIKRFYDEGYAKSIYYELSQLLNDKDTK
jgi:hypothetical protein